MIQKNIHKLNLVILFCFTGKKQHNEFQNETQVSQDRGHFSGLKSEDRIYTQQTNGNLTLEVVDFENLQDKPLQIKKNPAKRKHIYQEQPPIQERQDTQTVGSVEVNRNDSRINRILLLVLPCSVPNSMHLYSFNNSSGQTFSLDTLNKNLENYTKGNKLKKQDFRKMKKNIKEFFYMFGISSSRFDRTICSLIQDILKKFFEAEVKLKEMTTRIQQKASVIDDDFLKDHSSFEEQDIIDFLSERQQWITTHLSFSQYNCYIEKLKIRRNLKKFRDSKQKVSVQYIEKQLKKIHFKGEQYASFLELIIRFESNMITSFRNEYLECSVSENEIEKKIIEIENRQFKMNIKTFLLYVCSILFMILAIAPVFTFIIVFSTQVS